jgi:NAD(P)-dependent dehydrogenase (short-subunit alcohol dehydrogenase family)
MTHTPTPAPTGLSWLITGASSGIGLHVARAAARRGDRVAALARNLDGLAPLVEEFGEYVLPVAADVVDPISVQAAVDAAVTTFGGLDVVANNAGFGVFGPVEEATDDQARAVFDTNVFGVLNVLRAVLPVLRGQRRGHILQGSSYYGQVAHPGVGLLAATKYAVEGLTDALVGELAPLGIHVTLVEPGPTATAFLDNLDVVAASEHYQVVRDVQKSLGELPPSAFNTADRVATAILAAVDAEHPPLRLATGSHAVKEIRAALTARLDQITTWESVSTAVDVAAAV